MEGLGESVRSVNILTMGLKGVGPCPRYHGNLTPIHKDWEQIDHLSSTEPGPDERDTGPNGGSTGGLRGQGAHMFSLMDCPVSTRPTANLSCFYYQPRSGSRHFNSVLSAPIISLIWCTTTITARHTENNNGSLINTGAF